MRVSGDDEELSGANTFHLLQSGHASFVGRELDDDEWATYKAELKAQLARKRPIGFTAEWGDT